MSGFADLLIVFSTFMIKLLISSSDYESCLIEHLGQIKLALRSRKVPREAKDLDNCINKQNVIEILREMNLKRILNLPKLYLMIARNLFSVCRPNRVQQLLKLREKSLKRLDRAIDVQKLV